MAVVTRNRRPSPSLDRPFAAEAPPPIRAHVEAEAPDRGILEEDAEAPETRSRSRVEAPDAGEGRASLLEHEFTHGRSQS